MFQIDGYPQTFRMLGPLDRPQVFTLSFTYQLPFGRDRKYLSDTNRFVSAIVSGWQVSGVHTYSSGQPITIATQQSIPTLGSIWAVRVPDQPIRTGISCGDYDPGDPSKDRYLNIDAFGSPAPFTLGDTSVLSDVRTCGTLNEDYSVSKVFRINERFAGRFGADFFNVFNRHNWRGLAANVDNPATFGRFTAASVPRVIQLFVKLDF